MAATDYGPKTGASSDHPYDDPQPAEPPAPPAGKNRSTPPDDHTEIESEADLGDPSVR